MTPDDAATILLVEDDLATRTFLADNLSADGYELLVADCVSDGLRLLERKFPDLAVIDLGLPDASGYELLRHVRRADGVSSRLDPQTPLMVLSGRSSELDRVRGFDRGADDYVCKPFSYPELRSRVADLEKLQKQQQSLIAMKDSDLAAAQQRLGQAPATREAGGGGWYWLGLVVLLLVVGGWAVARRRQGLPAFYRGMDLLRPSVRRSAPPVPVGAGAPDRPDAADTGDDTSPRP
jgi:CheY-like chemotaxis protein